MNGGIKQQFVELYEGIIAKSNAGISTPLADAIITNTTMIMADVACRTKSNLTISGADMSISNNDAARKLLKRTYRKGYTHPADRA